MDAKETLDRAKDASLTFGRFVWHDVKGTARVFAKAAGVALAVGTAAIFVLVLASGHPRGHSLAQTLLVWVIGSVYYAAVPALMVGGAVATWRHFGWTTVLPLVVLPLMGAGVFTLAGPALLLLARDLVEAFVAAGRQYHWPAVQGVGRLAHAGPVAIPFVLAAVVFDGVHLLGDGRVLRAVLWLGVVVAGLQALAVALTVGATAPPMAWMFVRRARARWAAWNERVG